MTSNLDTEKDTSKLSLQWKTMGLIGSLIGVACLGALITVTTITEVDTLSTVALVLAILAFVIQIMIFIAQAVAATEQSKSTLAVNAETKSLLSDLRARAQATNDVINIQFNKLLDKMLLVTQESAQTVATDGDTSAQEGFESFLQEMRAALVELKSEVNAARTNTDGNVSTKSDRHYSRAILRTWPNRALEDSLYSHGLDSVSRSAAELLRDIGEHLMSHRDGTDSEFTLSNSTKGIDELLNKQLIKPIRIVGSHTLYGVTKKGLNAVRLVIAKPSQDAYRRFPWLAFVHSTHAAAPNGDEQDPPSGHG